MGINFSRKLDTCLPFERKNNVGSAEVEVRDLVALLDPLRSRRGTREMVTQLTEI